MLSIDLNGDMGESTSLWRYDIEKDFALLKWLSSVNLACGFHAGDAHTMHELVDAALEAGIAIGAHPGFADKENFGRTPMALSPERIYDIVLYQVGALDAFLKINGAALRHVKPHGALYNMAAADRVVADAIARAVYDYNGRLLLYGLSGSELIRAAEATGLRSCNEVFADRTYREDGSLSSRTTAHALIEKEEDSVQQVLQILQKGTVTAVSGKAIPVVAETICIHGDGPNALAFAKRIREVLQQEHIIVSAPVK
jgi:UPF0271 protein